MDGRGFRVWQATKCAALSWPRGRGTTMDGRIRMDATTKKHRFYADHKHAAE